MTFFIEVADPFIYSSIMELLVSSGLTHSKDQNGGITTLEISGSEKDFKIFEKIVQDGNKKAGGLGARILEGI